MHPPPICRCSCKDFQGFFQRSCRIFLWFCSPCCAEHPQELRGALHTPKPALHSKGMMPHPSSIPSAWEQLGCRDCCIKQLHFKANFWERLGADGLEPTTKPGHAKSGGEQSPASLACLRATSWDSQRTSSVPRMSPVAEKLNGASGGETLTQKRGKGEAHHP